MKNVATLQRDAAKSGLPDHSVDIIVTDAFLTRFLPADRPRILDEWTRILRLNGVVITTIRIGTGSDMVRASEDQVQAYVEDVKRAQKGNHAISLDDTVIGTLAEEYVRRMVSHPFKGEDEIRKLFAGYTTTITIVDTKGETQPTKYAEVVAVKKA